MRDRRVLALVLLTIDSGLVVHVDALAGEGPRAAVSAEELAMTIERVPLEQVDELIASRAVVDAKTIIGLLLARAFLAREPLTAEPGGA